MRALTFGFIFVIGGLSLATLATSQTLTQADACAARIHACATQ